MMMLMLKMVKYFCKTILDVSSLDNGEYTLYLLNNANEVIEKELLRIGDYNNNGYKIKKQFLFNMEENKNKIDLFLAAIDPYIKSNIVSGEEKK